MPAPNVSPPVARSAARPVSAPDTTPPITAALPSSSGASVRTSVASRASTSSAARPSSAWISISRSMLGAQRRRRGARPCAAARASRRLAVARASPSDLPSRAHQPVGGQRHAVAGGARDRCASAAMASSNCAMRRACHAAARRSNARRVAAGSTRRRREAARTPAPSSGRRRRARARRARGRAGERVAPARLVGVLLGARPRRPGLVEQHDHRLADPFEHRELRREVAGVGGRFRRVDEVEHDVGLVADVAHRLLRQPERPVAEAVPHLRQEPADRIAVLAQPLREPRAVAEPGVSHSTSASPSGVSTSANARGLGASRAARRGPRRRRGRAACARASSCPHWCARSATARSSCRRSRCAARVGLLAPSARARRRSRLPRARDRARRDSTKDRRARAPVNSALHSPRRSREARVRRRASASRKPTSSTIASSGCAGPRAARTAATNAPCASGSGVAVAIEQRDDGTRAVGAMLA